MYTDVKTYTWAMSVISGGGVNLYLRKFRVKQTFQGRTPLASHKLPVVSMQQSDLAYVT